MPTAATGTSLPVFPIQNACKKQVTNMHKLLPNIIKVFSKYFSWWTKKTKVSKNYFFFDQSVFCKQRSDIIVIIIDKNIQLSLPSR